MRPKPSVFMFVVLGFLLSALIDLACPRHASAMTMQPVGGDWDVAFEAHPDNESIRIAVECHKENKVWKATVVHDLENSVSKIRVRQPEVPDGYNCTAIGFVLRNPQHDGNYDHTTIGESVLILMRPV